LFWYKEGSNAKKNLLLAAFSIFYFYFFETTTPDRGFGRGPTNETTPQWVFFWGGVTGPVFGDRFST
jgi:hypothetical protein